MSSGCFWLLEAPKLFLNMQNMEVIRIFSCFLFMLPGMLSRRLSASHFSWPSFQCLMSLSSGLYYCAIGWFYLSSQWSAKSCTWSNTNMSHWILESRWASSFLKCLFSHQNIVVVLLSTFFCFQTAIVANHPAWRYCWFLCLIFPFQILTVCFSFFALFTEIRWQEKFCK